MELGQADILKRYHYYEQLAGVSRLSEAGAVAAAAATGANGGGETKQE
jgi:hypothetical protein